MTNKGLSLLFYQNELIIVPEHLLCRRIFKPEVYSKQAKNSTVSIKVGLKVINFDSLQILKISSYQTWKKLQFENPPKPRFIWFDGFIPYDLAMKTWTKPCTILTSNIGNYATLRLKKQTDSLGMVYKPMHSPTRISSWQ
jgi:hypothetical protein